MSVITKDLGIASAYGYAKSKGYTGTEEEFAELMASYADVAQQAEASAQDAEDAKDAAITAKTAAQTAQTAAESAQTAAAGSAQTASTKASEASNSAQTAAGSATAAGNSATAAAGSATAAQTAAQTATTKASEASSSASAASTAKTGAETARTGAQTAQANAEAAAASVSASAAQIEQNTEDISGLKNDLSEKADKTDALSAYVVETATGSIASFTDGADDVPVKDLTVAIEPVQSGSGDPSPENVRPITGWTGLSGQNTANAQQWDEEWEVGAISVSDGSLLNSENYMRSKNYIPVASGKTYYRAGVYMSDGRAFFYGQDKSFISHTSISAVVAFDIPYNACFMKFHKNGASYSNDISINYPSTDHDYHAYTGQSISVNWQTEAGTVYGGTLDVTTGVLTVTHGNIASYNGETLPSEWISDRDVYEAGTTPTTGAQVVYEIAEPQTYQLTPQEVSTVLGQNNIFADTGNVTVQYRADTKLYIDKVLNA